MKTEHLQIAKTTNHAALMGTPKCMSRIEHQLKVMFFGNGLQCFHIAGTSPNMDAHNARRARRDEALDLCGIDTMCARLNITKDRCDLLPLEGMGRGYKGKGWDNHFAFQ